jgi:hypothetical protein
MQETNTCIKTRKAGYTVLVDNASEELSQQARVIVLEHDAALKSADRTKSAHALAIVAAVGDLTGLHRHSYNTQMVIADEFYEKMMLPTNATHVEALGLTTDIAILKERRDTMHQHFIVREERQQQPASQPEMQPARRKFDSKYVRMTRNLRSVYRANENGANNPAVRAKCELLIDGINARLTRAKAAF